MKIIEKRLSYWLKEGDTFHSKLMKGPDPRTGMVWDVLASSTLLVGPPPVQVLMLGAGLGATVHVAEWALAIVHRDAHYTVVDTDEEVLEEMRKHLNLPVHYYLESAGDFVTGRKERYDVVIEDTFERFAKPEWVDAKLELAMALVDEHGVFVMNMINHQLPHYEHRIKAMFPYVVEVIIDDYPNSIVFASRHFLPDGFRRLVIDANRFIGMGNNIDVRILE